MKNYCLVTAPFNEQQPIAEFVTSIDLEKNVITTSKEYSNDVISDKSLSELLSTFEPNDLDTILTKCSVVKFDTEKKAKIIKQRVINDAMVYVHKKVETRQKFEKEYLSPESNDNYSNVENLLKEISKISDGTPVDVILDNGKDKRHFELTSNNDTYTINSDFKDMTELTLYVCLMFHYNSSVFIKKDNKLYCLEIIKKDNIFEINDFDIQLDIDSYLRLLFGLGEFTQCTRDGKERTLKVM